MDKEKTYRHESYGNIDIYRTQSNQSNPLFGTDLTHRNTINIDISLNELTRGLNHDYYYPYKKLISIELSPIQFAEAITNLNTSGVPCTIKYYDGKYLENPPYKNKSEIFRQEFSNTLNENTAIAKGLIVELTEKFKEKGTLKKADKKEILSLLNRLYNNLNGNLEYMLKCCQEQVDKTVAEGKAEIEAYISNKINTLGLQALKEESTDLVQLKDK